MFQYSAQKSSMLIQESWIKYYDTLTRALAHALISLKAKMLRMYKILQKQIKNIYFLKSFNLVMHIFINYSKSVSVQLR